MSKFIAMCVLTVVIAVIGVVLFIVSFSKRALETDSQWMLRWIAAVLAFMTFIEVYSLIFEYEECPNCRLFSNENYCRNCGYKLTSTVVCEGCATTFDSIETAPYYCYECGTPIKEKE